MKLKENYMIVKLEREIQIMDMHMKKRTKTDFKRLMIDIRTKVK